MEEPQSKRARLESPPKSNGNKKDKETTDLYLETIDRHMLDFDFEKVCSVSLSHLNVYACLTCGKYYQGRGKASHAYFHSIDKDHHVFINLTTLKVYVLPDGYEVDDPSLNDIKYVLNPILTKEQVAELDNTLKTAYDLNNKKYIPGFVGLNNIKANDYVNVIIQALAHIPPIRDYFILHDFESKGSSQLVCRFSTLVRKIWNPRAFKGQVSPHELVQEISNASRKRFKLTEQSNAIDFLSWFLNTLHKDLGGTKKRNSSIIYKYFQGEVKVESQEPGIATEKDALSNFDPRKPIKVQESPFLFLALDLPPVPLYQDERERDIVPQVPLTTILSKFDGKRVQEVSNELKRYSITRLPQYLILHIKRFTKNNWTNEKNPTIVNFPIKHLDMSNFSNDPEKETLGTHYDLLANISHEGGPESGKGSYKVHVRHRGTEQWYQIQDLIVEEMMPQMIFMSESYIQIWERKKRE
ncbi:Putative Ubiquitin thiolesterase [Rhizopus microsporus]|nr:Putative Ubiquitin thiolesterase [Rhizopus microsporus]